MLLKRTGRAGLLIAALILPLVPVHGLPIPSQAMPVSAPTGEAGGEPTLAGESALAILLLAAAIAAGGDGNKARDYGLAALGVWLVWMTIDEYVNAPENDVPLPVIY
ncbi:MAG: hypothetical protein ABIF71_00535 [Planctomycetota bacterium]